MLYVELVRASVGYLVDFLHITPDGEAVVNFESHAAACHAASILHGMSMLGSPGLSVGVSKIQGCGANILHYATHGQETDPKRTPFTQSFQYTCPAQEVEVTEGPRMVPGYTPAPFPQALSAVDMNVEGSLEMRSPKTSRFQSLGINLSELDDNDTAPISAERTERNSPA